MPLEFKTSIVQMVKDPFGNLVEIEQEMLQFTEEMKNSEGVFDDITTAIEKPAMMFKVPGSVPSLCYIRAIGWNKVILISVQKVGEYFKVISCEIDPPAKKLSELYNWADQLL